MYLDRATVGSDVGRGREISRGVDVNAEYSCAFGRPPMGNRPMQSRRRTGDHRRFFAEPLHDPDRSRAQSHLTNVRSANSPSIGAAGHLVAFGDRKIKLGERWIN